MSLLESWQSSPPPPTATTTLPYPFNHPLSFMRHRPPHLKGLPAMTATKKKLAIRSGEELSDQTPAYARKAVDPVIKFVFVICLGAPPLLDALGWGGRGPL